MRQQVRSIWHRATPATRTAASRVDDGALAGTGAFCEQRAAQCLGRQGAAVQSEAVTVRASREAMIEDSVQVLLRDSDPGINDGDQRRIVRCANPDGHTLLAGLRFVAGVLGVANHIYQDL